MSHFFRQLRYGISFALFGCGGLFLSYVIFPTVWIIVRDSRNREYTCQYIISFSFEMFVKFMVALGVIDLKIENGNKLVVGEGCLVVANHPTLIDVVIIISQLRQCDCIVKAELWHNPFVRHVVKMAGYIPNNSDDLLQLCQSKISQGRKLLVFPEGTRTVPNENIVCQRGAAQLAIRCNANIQRVQINCYPLTLNKGVAWYDVPKTRACFDLWVCDVESVVPIIESSKTTPLAARKLTNYFNVALKPIVENRFYVVKDYVNERP
ncbi:lysophospholipid acyltransferase family protein [Thaumasiovibrio sp. DFM-14]|uniref:lysophospholipid acyltransferase family protein n=1 Tax=Thaumasiovibrio sp. DFM-14 TaxID=3384792 RepID=UPI0039A1F8B8